MPEAVQGAARLSEFVPNTFWNDAGRAACWRRVIRPRRSVSSRLPQCCLQPLAIQAGQPQHRELGHRRHRPGRYGDDRRHVEPAARLPARHQARARLWQAGGGGRARRDLEPAPLRRADFKVLGEAEDVIKDFVAAWERGERSAYSPPRNSKSTVYYQDADPALRPAQAAAMICILRPVFARLPVHLRILRHHRTLRPQAARQDQCADAGRTRSSLRTRLSRPCRSSSTTI